MINYIDKNGKISRLYEKAYSESNSDTINDPNIDHDAQNKAKQLKEQFNTKTKNEIPLAIYDIKEPEKVYSEEKEPLPYNPDLIVVPKDPKPNNIKNKRELIINYEDDIPREDKMFIKDEESFYFKDNLGIEAKTEQEYNNIRLVNEINEYHPRKIDYNGIPSKFKICESLGYYLIRKNWLINEFSKFGLGLTDYFRILKNNFIIYLLCCLFGMILLIKNKTFNKNNFKEIKSNFGYFNLYDTFMFLSYGATIYKNYYKCDLLNFNDENYDEDYIYYLTCDNEIENVKTNTFDNYTIYKTSISLFEINNEEKIENMYDLKYCYDFNRNGRIQGLKKTIKNYDALYQSTYCEEDHKSCYVNFTDFFYLTEQESINQIIIQYQCVYNPLKNPNLKTKIYFILNYILFVIYITYITYMIYMSYLSIKTYKENVYDISQYSVYVKNITLSQKAPELFIELNKLIQVVIDASQYQNLPYYQDIIDNYFGDLPAYVPTYSIYQINYSLFDNNILDLVKEKYKFLEKFEIPKYHKNRKNNVFTSKLEEKEYDLDLDKEKRNDNIDIIKNYNNNIQFCEKDKDEIQIKDIIFTFKTKAHAKKFYNCYKSKNCFYRMMMYIICRKKDITKFYYNGKWLDVEYIPSPSDGILYENLRINKRISLKCSSYLIMFLFIIISLFIYFIGTIYLRKFHNKLEMFSKCDYYLNVYHNKITHYNIQNEINYEYNQNKILTYCYCKYSYNFLGKNHTKFLNYTYSSSNSITNNEIYIYPCRKFINNIEQSKLINILILISIQLLNIIFFYCVPFITDLERNRTVMDNRLSTMKKVFIYSLFSNGLNIIIVNSNINDWYTNHLSFFPILSGNILPFNSEWFYYINNIIALNVILSCINPYFIDYLKFFIMFIIRKFFCNELLKEKNKYKFLYYFIGPEYYLEIKFGNHLALNVLCILFNFILLNPLIMFSMALLTIIAFYLDKILFIRYCKTPFKYNEYLTKFYLKIIYITLIITSFIQVYQSGIIAKFIPNSMKINMQIKYSFKYASCFCFIIFGALMIIVPFFIFKILPVILYLTYYKRDVAYGFAEDENFEKNSKKDFIIYESLPLSAIYKNYTIRKLEFRNIIKYELDYDLTFLLNFYRQRLDTDRTAIYTKLKFLTGKICNVDRNFDVKIKNIMDKYEEEIDDTKIDKDFSYNMSYYDIYQTLYLNELTKN